jgi:hypothetical protein
MQLLATETVLKQAEMIANELVENWTNESNYHDFPYLLKNRLF